MAGNEQEKKPVLKSIFQWSAAIIAPFGCEAPNRAYEQAGQTFDYLQTRHRASKAAKLT
jgi:hypothetical protein